MFPVQRDDMQKVRNSPNFLDRFSPLLRLDCIKNSLDIMLDCNKIASEIPLFDIATGGDSLRLYARIVCTFPSCLLPVLVPRSSGETSLAGYVSCVLMC